jgi:muramidase (phage lysozyme)
VGGIIAHPPIRMISYQQKYLGLLYKHKAMSSNPSPTKKKKKRAEHCSTAFGRVQTDVLNSKWKSYKALCAILSVKSRRTGRMM